MKNRDQTAPGDDELILIPAGEFEMGSDQWDIDERPIRTVYVEAFYIDQFEVTNQQYARFLTAVGSPIDDEGNVLINLDLPFVQIGVSENGYISNPGYEKSPVVGVSWYGATAYAHWASKRLLTETEWEKAARASDGRIYPWGDHPPSAEMLNYKRRHNGPVPAKSYPQDMSPFGVYDMAGNVAEWVMDSYRVTPHSAEAERPHAKTENALDSAKAQSPAKVVRGGAWVNLHPISVRAANRFMLSPDQMTSWVGFPLRGRCEIERKT